MSVVAVLMNRLSVALQEWAIASSAPPSTAKPTAKARTSAAAMTPILRSPTHDRRAIGFPQCLAGVSPERGDVPARRKEKGRLGCGSESPLTNE